MGSDELIIKLEQVEKQNNDLLQQLKMTEADNEELRRKLTEILNEESAQDTASEQSDEKTQEDSKEQEEDLFDAFGIDIDDDPRHTVIEKYKFLGFELQLRKTHRMDWQSRKTNSFMNVKQIIKGN